jgi:DNA-binding NtrC family response regulator
LETQPADVIIMDVSMPEVDGIACLKKVKQRWPMVEVIILTGHASVKSGIEGMQSGAFDYCLKPIDVLELLEKVELAAQKALINQGK